MASRQGLARWPLLLNPPGAAPYLGLLVAVGGWQVGLNGPTTLGRIALLPALLETPPSRWGLLAAVVPSPSPLAVASSWLLGLLILGGLGGWIAAVDAANRREPLEGAWLAGMRPGLRQLAVLAAWIRKAGVLVVGRIGLAWLGWQVLAIALIEGLVALPLPGAALLAMVALGLVALGNGLGIVLSLAYLASCDMTCDVRNPMTSAQTSSPLGP